MRRYGGGSWYGWWPYWPYGADLASEYEYEDPDPYYAAYLAAQAQAAQAQAAQAQAAQAIQAQAQAAQAIQAQAIQTQAAQAAQEDAMVGAARALAEPHNELISMLPAIGPRSGISCCMDFDAVGHLLRVSVTVDGQTYQACTNLSAELGQVQSECG